MLTKRNLLDLRGEQLKAKWIKLVLVLNAHVNKDMDKRD